jgi:hypothetical protein
LPQPIRKTVTNAVIVVERKGRITEEELSMSLYHRGCADGKCRMVTTCKPGAKARPETLGIR